MFDVKEVLCGKIFEDFMMNKLKVSKIKSLLNMANSELNFRLRLRLWILLRKNWGDFYG